MLLSFFFSYALTSLNFIIFYNYSFVLSHGVRLHYTLISLFFPFSKRHFHIYIYSKKKLRYAKCVVYCNYLLSACLLHKSGRFLKVRFIVLPNMHHTISLRFQNAVSKVSNSQSQKGVCFGVPKCNTWLHSFGSVQYILVLLFSLKGKSNLKY